MYQKRKIYLIRLLVFLCMLIIPKFISAKTNITEGLVAYYPFNGNANDESGNGNNGTVYGATLTMDRFGNANNAYIFDGINDYILVPDNNSLDLSIGLTITAWIYSSDTSGPRVIISKWNDNTWEHSYLFKDHNSSDKLRISLSKGNFYDLADIEGSTSITVGKWMCVAVTYDFNTITLYVNGIEDVSSKRTGTIANSVTNMLIGAVYTGGGIKEYFSGILDDIRIYNRALSVSEIQALYNENVSSPDLQIRNKNDTTYIGSNIYNTTGIRQTKTQIVEQNSTATFLLKIQNNMDTTDNFIVTDSNSSSGWNVKYYDAANGGSDITNQVTGNGWKTASLVDGASLELRVEVTPDTSVKDGAMNIIQIKVKSSSDPAKYDVAKAKTFTSTGDIVDTLMPEAAVLARGSLPLMSINLDAILNDNSLNAVQIGDYVVWKKPLSDFQGKPTSNRINIEAFQGTVDLTFALSGTGSFYFGAEGSLPDILSVVGTLYWGGLGSDPSYGLGESPATPSDRSKDNGIYEPKDIGLVGIGWKELLNLQNKYYLAGISANDYDFRNASSIIVKHKLEKPIFTIYYPIFIIRGSENGDWGVDFEMNAQWSQFASVFDNGTAIRSVQINYKNPIASYIYPVVLNNNSEQSWIKLDSTEILHQYNWGVQIKKLYDKYPSSIELGGIKTWGEIEPAVTLTVVADSTNVYNWQENPSLGLRRNPSPDVLVLQPNVWTIPQSPVITQINNNIVSAKIDPNRGCVTSLVFKKGSNKELIATQWGSYLIDLGSGRLGDYLKSGWKLEKSDVQSNYIKWSLKHPSRFTNDIVLSWTENHVEVRCDINAPDSTDIFGVLYPGGGCEKNRDKWAFPITDSVKTGDFLYPGPQTALYPSDNSWDTTQKGWFALWDEQVDEVYGFTYSGDIKTKIANGAATDHFFLVPSGNSRISFHIIKSKPSTPYEAIENLSKVPYLTLNQQVDKIFASSGNELNYTLTFKDTGDIDATGVTIKVNLPSDVKAIDGSISNNGIYDFATHSITWNIDSFLAKGEEQSVTFKVKINQNIPDGTQLVCTSRIWCAEQTIAINGSTLTTIASPSITSISPDKGGNAGNVTVTIKGNYLDPKAEVKLVKGSEEIIATGVSGSNNGNSINATFDLVGKTPGISDLVVTNPGSGTVISSNAFTIEEGGEAKLWVDIVGRDTIRVGREQTYWIRYGNSGNINAIYPYIVLMFPKDVEYKIVGDFSGLIPTDDTFSVSSDPDAIKASVLDVCDIQPNVNNSIQVKVKVNKLGDWKIKGYLTLDKKIIYSSMLSFAKSLFEELTEGEELKQKNELKKEEVSFPIRDDSNSPPADYIIFWSIKYYDNQELKKKVVWHSAKSLGGGEFIEIGSVDNGPDIHIKNLNNDPYPAC